VRAELICDGIHVHPASVRLAFKMFGPDRMILISDALRCCGMPNGEYELGGQTVYLADSVGRLADGTIAGAATNLYDGMKNAVKFGISKEEAILSATANPAKALGADDRIGSIEPGKYADFVITNADYSEKRVFIGGKEI
jgi:N-acetylglucosamine-6-phosphate deacetylase